MFPGAAEGTRIMDPPIDPNMNSVPSVRLKFSRVLAIAEVVSVSMSSSFVYVHTREDLTGKY